MAQDEKLSKTCFKLNDETLDFVSVGFLQNFRCDFAFQSFSFNFLCDLWKKQLVIDVQKLRNSDNLLHEHV